MEKFFERCIRNLVHNRIGQDPNASNCDEGSVDSFSQQSSTENTCRCALTSASVAAVIDLPLELPYRPPRVSTGIPQAASISDFLQIKNKKDEAIENGLGSHPLDGGRRLRRSLFHVWDNSLALKLLGTKKRILEEQERQEHISHWLIHPCSKFRYVISYYMIVV